MKSELQIKGERCFEYEIYVPTASAEGKVIDLGILDSARRDLVDYFGGLTDSRIRSEGLWKVGNVVVRDEVLIWKIMSMRGADGDRKIRETKSQLEKTLAQDEILVVRREVCRL